MSGVIKTNNFNICDLMISKLCKNKQGNNTVFISTKSNNKIILQTPKMPAPFGVSEYTTEGGLKYSLNLSFLQIDSDSKVEKFYTMCKDIDNMMIETAFTNSTKWFGKQLSKDVIEEFYRPLLKPGKHKEGDEYYPDTIKFKLRTYNDKLTVSMFDKEKNPIGLENVVKGSKVRCIFEVSPIWFVNKNFGISLNCIQLEVDNIDKMVGYSFYDSDDDPI